MKLQIKARLKKAFFYIVKQSRDSDKPYCGPASDNKEMKFDSMEEAEREKKWLEKKNPVGWKIKKSK